MDTLTTRIIAALDALYADLTRQVEAKTMPVDHRYPVTGMSLADLLDAQKAGNFPPTAELESSDPEEMFSTSEVYMSWVTYRPATSDEKMKEVARRFNTWAFGRVVPVMRDAGYIRVGVNTRNLKKYPTVWDGYCAKDYPTLTAYFLEFFRKD